MSCFAALKIAIASIDPVCIEKEVALYGRLNHHDVQVDGARRFVHLCDFFHHAGPNGQHSCWVFEPMGPNLNTMLKRCPDFQIGEPWERRFTPQYAKRLLRDTLYGLDFLHSNDVVHGDLHPGNILVAIRPLEADDKMIQDLETWPSQGSSLDRLDGKADLWAPPYLLQPDPLYDYTSADLEPLAKITDLGAGEFLSNFESEFCCKNTNTVQHSLYTILPKRQLPLQL